MSGRGFTSFTALVAILVLAMAVPVFAQTSPAANAYGGQQGEVLGNFNGGGQDDVIPPPAETAPSGGGQQPDTPQPTNAVPTERGVDTPTPSVSSGDLPFTGFEAGLVALAGLALLGTGFAMRRGTRQPA
jgi:hypothetical protein